MREKCEECSLKHTKDTNTSAIKIQTLCMHKQQVVSQMEEAEQQKSHDVALKRSKRKLLTL